MSSKRHQARYLVPNGITFVSLFCGTFSLMNAFAGHYFIAGAFILASYILDLFDGATARRLDASTEFGLQLDSLVDLVSLGVAPGMLTFAYLASVGEIGFSVWLGVAIFIFSGAYRLARFNLLPPKEASNKDSVGLTISAAGATAALAVMTNVTTGPLFIEPQLYFYLLLGLSILMISRIPYPSFGQIAADKWVTPLSIGGALLVGFWLWSFIQAWFVCNLGYLTLSLARAGMRRKS